MKTLGVMVGAWVALWLGACRDDAGAILVLSAPDGPRQVAQLEVILASADDAMITREIDQRVAKGSFREDKVTYYRQRATGGESGLVAAVHGYTIRIEPELAVARDPAFVPFVLLRDDDGRVVAVGTVDDADGRPASIDVGAERRVEYAVTVRSLLDPAAGRAVACDDWTSGIVWRPSTGPEVRLLLADRAMDAGATDASDRPLDLDCDQVAADDPMARDCDDTEPSIFPGAPELCDGVDTDCDASEVVKADCTLMAPIICNGVSTTTGTHACREPEGEPPQGSGVCLASASCPCMGAACDSCELSVTNQGGLRYATCQPAVVSVSVCDNATCSVEVASVTGNLDVKIGGESTGPFGPSLGPRPNGLVFIRVQDTFVGPRMFAANQLRAEIGSVTFRLGYVGNPATVLRTANLFANRDLPCATDMDGNTTLLCSW